MIKVELQNLLDSMPIFQELISQKLAARTACKVNKIVKAINKEYEIFDETRRSIIDKYGERDENGEIKSDENGNLQIKKDQTDKFVQELQGLLTTEVELNVSPLYIEEIEDATFTPAQIDIMSAFIDMNTEE